MTTLLDVLGKLLFRSAIVDSATALTPSFRRLVLHGDALRGVPIAPGDKVQLLIPDEGMRTYTPFGGNPADGTIELLVFAHGDGPGARWGQTVAAGEAVRLFGPRRSLVLPGDEPIVLFGDETSFAVAHAYAAAGRTVLPVFEVREVAASAPVLEALQLTDAVLVPRSSDETHLTTVYGHLTAQLARGEYALALTGRAQAIQALRRMDRDKGQKAKATKAYWSLGKRGLD